jgi:hypothetical protein
MRGGCHTSVCCPQVATFELGQGQVIAIIGRRTLIDESQPPCLIEDLAVMPKVEVDIMENIKGLFPRLL